MLLACFWPVVEWGRRREKWPVDLCVTGSEKEPFLFQNVIITIIESQPIRSTGGGQRQHNNKERLLSPGQGRSRNDRYITTKRGLIEPISLYSIGTIQALGTFDEKSGALSYPLYNNNNNNNNTTATDSPLSAKTRQIKEEKSLSSFCVDCRHPSDRRNSFS